MGNNPNYLIEDHTHGVFISINSKSYLLSDMMATNGWLSWVFVIRSCLLGTLNLKNNVNFISCVEHNLKSVLADE